MVFFHYRPSTDLAFTMLRHGEVFFASAAELNDAHECRPRLILRGSLELWQRFADYVLVQVQLRAAPYFKTFEHELAGLSAIAESVGVAIKHKVRNRDLSIIELPEIFVPVLQAHLAAKYEKQEVAWVCRQAQRILDSLPELLFEGKYIASFSRVATNPTMWGHYAAADKGFVVVYQSDDGMVSVSSPVAVFEGTRPSEGDPECCVVGIYKEERVKLQPVRYVPSPPKVNAFFGLIPKFRYSEAEHHYDVPLMLPGDAPSKQEDLIGLVKYSDWRYEREIRLFLPSISLHPPEVRALTIEPTHFKGVVFGPKMTCVDRERAVLCSHLRWKSLAPVSGEQPMGEVIFFEAKQCENRFSFEIAPVGLLEGNYYSRRLPFKHISKCDVKTVERLHRIAKEVEAGG